MRKNHKKFILDYFDFKMKFRLYNLNDFNRGDKREVKQMYINSRSICLLPKNVTNK